MKVGFGQRKRVSVGTLRRATGSSIACNVCGSTERPAATSWTLSLQKNGDKRTVSTLTDCMPIIAVRNPDLRMLNSAKRAAKEKGLNFNLTVEDTQVPAWCPALGIKLVSKIGPRRNNSPSLDRIVPSLGYVKGNVVVVSWLANRIKTDATTDQLLRVARFYARLQKETTRDRQLSLADDANE